jgi:hypothetical protein
MVFAPVENESIFTELVTLEAPPGPKGRRGSCGVSRVGKLDLIVPKVVVELPYAPLDPIIE